MGRREMNLKHVNSLKGTGTRPEDKDTTYSPKPFVNYLYTMLEILMYLFLFCFMTTNNYLNAKNFDVKVDYPVGDALKGLMKSNASKNISPESPYCNSFVKCNQVPLNKSENVPKFSWWFQTTQESCYRVAGTMLHYYFNFMQKWCISYPPGIPYTGYISFARWTIFGILTLITMVVLLCTIWIIFIPGWFGGLFAFMKLQTNDINKFGLLCLSAFLTLCFGWVSIFPVIYEFFYLLYLFFIKQLIQSDEYGSEFAKRMSNLIVVFVIVAAIVAIIQLPPISAGIIASVTFLAILFMKNKSLYKQPA
jgi:hypothetical protein